MGNAVLKITDGTSANTVNLLDLLEGFDVEGWRQAVAQFKAGGVFSQSALAEGRRLVAKRFANVQETFPIPAATEEEADITAWAVQKLLRVCQLASDYWVETWRTAPVYLESRADCETESRYAVVHWAGVPELGDVYSGEFLRHAVMQDLSLVAERGHWRSTVPTGADCVEISGQGLASINDISVNYAVSQSSDDADYQDGGILFGLANGTLLLGKSPLHPFYFGTRFQNVLVPAGATIISAFLRFECSTATAGVDCKVIIYGENDFDPSTFSTFADFISRPRTIASVNWPTVGASIGAWVLGADYDSPSLSTIIQEIIEIPGWASGQSMVLFVDDNGSDVNADRFAGAWDNIVHDPPELHILYRTSTTVGRAETCNDEVYVANKRNTAGLSHIYVDDGGFGVNQVANTAFNLLPVVPAVNDAVYFGIQSSLTAAGPFSSIIFDLVAGDDVNCQWEYRDAGTGWTQIPNLIDRTDPSFFGLLPLIVNGVNGVFWQPPSTWTTFAVNGITAWWVRCLVTAVGGAEVGAQQQNRKVYTITWDSVLIDDAQVGGDISALARHLLRDQGGNFDGGILPWTNRIVCGLRSVSRGADFVALLNCAPDNPGAGQNPTGVTVGHYPLVTDQAVVECATGTAARFTPVGATEAMATRVGFNLNGNIAPQFTGRFHAYVRAKQNSGSAGDFEVRLRIEFGAGLQPFTTDAVATYITGQWQLLDLEAVIIPAPEHVLAGESYELDLYVQASSSNNTATLDFYDLVLIPVDEWAGDFFDPDTIGEDAATTYQNLVEIDSAVNPRTHVRSLVENKKSGYVEAIWLPIVNGPVQLRQNTDQRLHFLFSRYTAAGVEISEPFVWSTVQSFAARRYLGMRGAN